MKYLFLSALIIFFNASCHNKDEDADASGSFEADETIVSSEMGGLITAFNIEEGDTLSAGQVAGTIDAKNVSIQVEQVEASIKALSEKTLDVYPQVQLLLDQAKVQQAQLDHLLQERTRTENLVKADAAPRKQLDDINSQIDILQKQISVTNQQIKVQRNNVAAQNRAVLSEKAPLEKKIEQLKEQKGKSQIVNPVPGIVITRYAAVGEVTNPGKALYKLADLKEIILRAYVTGLQLPQIKTGQQVTVLVDSTEDTYKTYPGTITWISDQAEFTPKTVQTKEERANLVYAIKVKVKNDGYLKIGMYADLQLKKP